jgi:hypothetical protein
MDDQALLDKVNAAIARLLDGGAVQRWSEGGHSVDHMPIDKLYALRTQLENQIAAAGAPLCFPITGGRA